MVENTKRGMQAAPPIKEMKRGVALMKREFGKVERKHEVNVGVESIRKTALSSLVAAFAGIGRILR